MSTGNLSIRDLADRLVAVAEQLVLAGKSQTIEELKQLELRQRELLQALSERALSHPGELESESRRKLQHYQRLNDQYMKELGERYAVVHFDRSRQDISHLL